MNQLFDITVSCGPDLQSAMTEFTKVMAVKYPNGVKSFLFFQQFGEWRPSSVGQPSYTCYVTGVFELPEVQEPSKENNYNMTIEQQTCVHDFVPVVPAPSGTRADTDFWHCSKCKLSKHIYNLMMKEDQ